MQKNSEKNPCYSEAEKALKTAIPYLPPFSEVKYFFQCIVKNFLVSASENLDRRIVIMGSSLPEEIIYACREKPHWVLGGSAQMAALADYAVPRDTDPVSRSSPGFLLREKEDSVIIIPLVNDSSRKFICVADGYAVSAESKLLEYFLGMHKHILYVFDIGQDRIYTIYRRRKKDGRDERFI